MVAQAGRVNRRTAWGRTGGEAWFSIFTRIPAWESQSQVFYLQSQEGGKLYCPTACVLRAWQDGRICCPKERHSEENWSVPFLPAMGTDGLLLRGAAQQVFCEWRWAGCAGPGGPSRRLTWYLAHVGSRSRGDVTPGLVHRSLERQLIRVLPQLCGVIRTESLPPLDRREKSTQGR